MEERKSKKQRIYLGIGIVLFLILVLSASYAYFQITSINNATTTTITGNGEALGTPTLTTNTTSLGLDLTAELMGSANSYKYLFATTNGTPVITQSLRPNMTTVSLNNGEYVLATASVAGGDISYNCNYAFDISATVDKAITDGSDEDVYVTITTPTSEVNRFTLSQLLAGTKTISGTIANLTKGKNQEFYINSFVYNYPTINQDGLQGNGYTIKVTPKSGTQGFSCSATTAPVNTGFAKNLIDSNKMIQTELKNDGYHFVGMGEGNFCSYDNGNFIRKQTTSGTCPTLYNTIETDTSTNEVFKYLYDSSCDASTDGSITYSCETLNPTVVSNQDPANYVCFGTTNKSTCTSNLDKYMYRVVGVFPDEVGNNHVMLIKSTTIGNYAFHSNATPLIEWKDTDLYKGLNGSYFYTNTTYDYMQNTTWRGKIADWRWSSYNTGQNHKGTANDVNGYRFLIGSSTKITPLYNMEHNNALKETPGGMWSYATAKIGLLKYTDYLLAHPKYQLLDIDPKSGEYFDNQNLLAPNWINYNPVRTEKEWTLLMLTNFIHPLETYTMSSSLFPFATSTETGRVRPVFYLNSNVELSSGTGTKNDPYILK